MVLTPKMSMDAPQCPLKNAQSTIISYKIHYKKIYSNFHENYLNPHKFNLFIYLYNINNRKKSHSKIYSTMSFNVSCIFKYISFNIKFHINKRPWHERFDEHKKCCMKIKYIKNINFNIIPLQFFCHA